VDVNALVAALEDVILERVADDAFVRRGALPAWCHRLPSARPLRGEQPFAIEAVFPFLGAYLEDAKRCWAADPGGNASSGFWTETDMAGDELHLEAFPVHAGGNDVLVVARNERLYAQERLVLQRARELRLAHDELGREIEQKDVLLHTVVHDLATPLQRVLSMLALLSERPWGEPEAEWLARAFEAATQEKQLVSEVLEVFSAEQDAPPISPAAGAPADVCAAIARVTSEFEPIARRGDIQLSAGPCPSPCFVLAETRRLVRVLANLVDGALRNSPTGGRVDIGVRCEGESVEVVVDDDGPQVAIDHLPDLFEKLARAGDRDVGTGLGLYFCRITLERWGGGTGYEPRTPRGARFWVRLRAARDAGDAVRPP
jgi:signal transduction histidine kinase